MKNWSTLKKLIWLREVNGGGGTPEVWKTVTGSIVSFVTSVAYPMRKFLAQIEPQQDLHGYDAPWAGGAGKNLFDPTANPNKWINASGQLTTVTGAKASQQIPCAQGDTFTVSTESGISTLAICFYASDDSVTQRTAQQDSASLTATAPANTAYVRSATYGESGKEVQLEKGSSKTSFLPYANECPITGWTGLSGGVFDINLLNQDGTNTNNGYVNHAYLNVYDGSVSQAEGTWDVMEYVPVKPNTTYTLSGTSANSSNGWAEYDINKVQVAHGMVSVSPFTFTTGANTYFVRFNRNYATDTQCQINLGSSALPYVPYIAPNPITCTWQSEAGTVYGGTVDVVTGVLTVDRVSVDMGTLSYSYDSTNAFFSVTPSGIKTPLASIAEVICSTYKVNAGISDSAMATADTGIYLVLSNGKHKIKDTRYTTASAIQTALTGQSLCFPLATPQTYQLTPQQISTLLGNNTVFVDTGDVEVEYLESGLPAEYTQVEGFTFNSDCYFTIDGLKLKGSDTVMFSMVPRIACNAFGCYTTSDADNNYSLYVSTANNAKYLRYDGSTYKSKFASGDLGERYDISITPTGSHGFPEGQDDTWTEATFEASTDLCIGTTATNASSAKFKGDLLGVFVVAGRFSGVPCKRNSDNVLGYYDMKSKKFYEPAVGTPTVIE